MKKSIKTASLLTAAALLCGSVTGCQNAAENKKVINYNNVSEIQIDETDGFYLKDGYYYQYIDPKTNMAAPVCGKPDCKHEMMDENCTAGFLRWNASQLYYYQDHLYYANKSGDLIQTDSAGSNEKTMLSGGEFIDERAKEAVKQNEKLRMGRNGMTICGVHDGKMYLLVSNCIQWVTGPSSASSGFTHVYALLAYDLKTGEVKTCEDEQIRKLMEDIPLHYKVSASVCGDLLIINVNTTKREPLPVTEDYLESEEWKSGNTFTEEIGEVTEYCYHIPSKKILKEWSHPDDAENTGGGTNPDGTFYQMEKQEDGTYQYTEYNQSCEETASFTVEYKVSIKKYKDSYYYERFELIDNATQKIGDLTQYNIKTGKTKTFPMEESISMHTIVGDVMVLYGSPDGSSRISLVDMSCFDTGKLEIRPVQGLLEVLTSSEGD